MAGKSKRKADGASTFRDILLLRRGHIVGDKDRLHDEALSKSTQAASGDLSNVPFHMADAGSDNYEQEFALGLIENEEQELREIDAALGRIQAGTFGQCETCGKSIRKARLKAIPYARLCIECKRVEENNPGSR